MTGYTARQLIRYHAYCTANPEGHILPPGGCRDWDDMPAASWLAWFWSCLTAKINRGLVFAGKGNRSAKRVWEIRKAAVRCHECGSACEHANPNASHNYCNGCKGR